MTVTQLDKDRILEVHKKPAEIVKIGFIITFAKHLSMIKNVNNHRNLFVLILHIVPIAGLILLQPDLGTTMVFMCIFAGMIFVAGISYKYIFDFCYSKSYNKSFKWFSHIGLWRCLKIDHIETGNFYLGL